MSLHPSNHIHLLAHVLHWIPSAVKSPNSLTGTSRLAAFSSTVVALQPSSQPITFQLGFKKTLILTMQDLRCRMQDLVPPGISPGALHWERGVLAARPSGTSPPFHFQSKPHTLSPQSPLILLSLPPLFLSGKLPRLSDPYLYLSSSRKLPESPTVCVRGSWPETLPHSPFLSFIRAFCFFMTQIIITCSLSRIYHCAFVFV